MRDRCYPPLTLTHLPTLHTLLPLTTPPSTDPLPFYPPATLTTLIPVSCTYPFSSIYLSHSATRNYPIILTFHLPITPLPHPVTLTTPTSLSSTYPYSSTYLSHSTSLTYSTSYIPPTHYPSTSPWAPPHHPSSTLTLTRPP